VLTFLLVVLFTRWQKLNLTQVGAVPGKQTMRRFVTGYIAGLAMAVLQALTVVSFGHLHLVIVPHISAIGIILPLLLYFFVATREELAFRSFAIRTLDYAFQSAFALALITIIFILEHIVAGMTWKMAIIGSGLGGILFGISALKTKGLALPVGLHSAWNFGQWAMGFKNKPGIWEATVEKGYEAKTENTSLAAFILVMVLAIAAVLFFYKNKMEEDKELANIRIQK
jgi:membrane protease YdiL (CAAX protease family)